MTLLVIGYGNDLRSDEGAGRVVADRIAAMGVRDVRARSVRQLTADLALDIASADTVVFVSTSLDVAETTMTPVVSEALPQSEATFCNTPGSLLATTGTVDRTPERAVAISIPVTELGLGMGLTPMTEIAVEQAISLITDIAAEEFAP